MGLPADVPVTTSAGAKATVCAEHAITLLLAASRRLWEIRAAQDRHYWARVELNFTIRSLEAGTLAVIGIGGIGREVARKAKAFDMTVIGVSRAPAPTANFDAVMPRQRMADALAQADAVIVTTSSDPANHRLIDAAALGAMKQSAYLVNVARGEIVDQAALVDALTSGGIAGAALDVTDPDPLPSESPLWDMENVIITPHVSAAGSRIGYERLRAIFAEELANLEAGTPFEHLYRGGG
jgi:phosphoglycerate dehydrogenase-like enzyme